MHHGDTLHRMREGDLEADLRHHLERHGFVTFIIQAPCGTSLGMVADRALEGHYRALDTGQQASDLSSDIDGVAGESEVVAGFADFQVVGVAPTADGRQEGYLIAVGEPGGGVGKFLITRHYDAAGQVAEGRKACRVGGENGAQIGSLGEFGLFPGHTNNILQHPKKQYARTHRESVTLSLTDASGRPSGCAELQSFFPMKPQTESRLRVRYAETDQMGVVYYANYLVWMEVGRVELCKSCGFNYRDMESEDGIFLAVAESHCEYRHPARFDDEVIVKTWIEKASTRMVTFDGERPTAGYGIHPPRLCLARHASDAPAAEVPRFVWIGVTSGGLEVRVRAALGWPITNRPQVNNLPH